MEISIGFVSIIMFGLLIVGGIYFGRLAIRLLKAIIKKLEQ